MQKKLLKLAVLGSMLSPFAASAQIFGGSNPPTLPNSPVLNYGDVRDVLLTVTNWIFGLLILLAVIFVLIAAFKYLTASGDPEKVKSASNTLIYAAIAVAVALLARGIPFLVYSFFGTAGAPPV